MPPRERANAEARPSPQRLPLPPGHVLGDASRLRLAVYDGGHTPYLSSERRADMREDARKLIAGEAPAGQR